MSAKLSAQLMMDPRDPAVRAACAEAEDPTAARNALRVRLAVRRFDLAKPPPEPVARFFINGKAVCTPGNLTNLIAQAKAGKSAFIAAIMAAKIVAEFGSQDRDCLGVTSTAAAGWVILHIDTEQAPFDHHALMKRALRRAGVEEAPAWLHSYGLAGYAAGELRGALKTLLEDIVADGNRLFAVIVDGIADLVCDVNDPEECNAFVAELHGLAIAYDCPVINIIHENPNSDNGKGRGHLGSQLERKAESNLRLRKTDEVTVVFSEKMRRAPILEKDGPRFRWSDEAGMHVSVESAGDAARDVELEDLRDLAAEVLGDGAPKGWSKLIEGIQEARNIKSSTTAEKRIKRMKALGVIRSAGRGQWMKAL